MDFCGSVLTLLDPFNEADTLAAVQPGQQLYNLFMAAARSLLYLGQRVVDEIAAQLVVPPILGRQAHSIEQKAI